MIPLSDDFDLGRDASRMKDPRDAARQKATAADLLERLYRPEARKRWEIQLLADEVGMGKTFVSLAVAYSVLKAMQRGHDTDDLDGCYQKVLIITPQNRPLFGNWKREVDEFVRRCVMPAQQEEAKSWFHAADGARADE